MSDRIYHGRLHATVSEVVDAVDLLPHYELAAIAVLEGQERPGEEPAVRRRLRSEGIRPREHRGLQLPVRLRQVAATAGGHHQRQAAQPGRVPHREVLRHHAAHGRAADVRAAQAERLDQRGAVVGQVGQRVRAPHAQAGEVAQRVQREVGHAEVVEALRQADVAVVEADHAKAARHEPRDEALGPAQQLHAQAHDQQQRRAPPRPKLLDHQPDAGGGDQHQARSGGVR